MNALFSEISNCLYTWEDASQIDSALTPSLSDTMLNSRGLFRLPDPNPPTPGPYQFVVENLPVKIEQGYQRRYTIAEMFPAPMLDPITGEVLSVQDQKDRYDAQIAARVQAEKDAQTINPRQGRQALIEMELDDQVEAAIQAIQDEKQRKTIRNWYENSLEWQYGNPVLTQFAVVLGVDKDEFFTLAKTL